VGGATPNTIHYIYTQDMARHQWVDTMYPYAGVIMSILPKIRWKDFTYKGPFIIETDGLEGESCKNKFSINVPTPKIYETTGFCTPVSQAPYEIFGGAACELWGTKFPKIPIHKYVDNTGDIDIKVSLPFVVPKNKALTDIIDICGDDAISPLMLYNDTYTPYGDAFTHWLFDEVVEQFRDIASQFNIKELELPGREENSETALGDLDETLGNLLITRLISKNKSMIKIQVSTKVLPDTVNHIMEFIILPKGNFRSRTKYTVNGIYVQGPIELLHGQVKGLKGRVKELTDRSNDTMPLEKSPSFYKTDNHCARLLYLATLLKFVEGTRYPENRINFPYLTEWQVNNILKKIHKHGRDAICIIHFGPEYMNKLIHIFKSMEYIGVS